MLPSRARLRIGLIAVWCVVVIAALYLFFFQRDWVQSELKNANALSLFAGGAVYLLFASLRGFSLIPSTYLLLAALPFFPPGVLLLLTLVGILISSSCIYFFSEALRLDEYFEQKHPAGVAKIKRVLQRHELPIIVGWSFFPLAPTDLICYVCGVMKVNFRKFLLGVLLGEGTICAIYISLGNEALRRLHLSL